MVEALVRPARSDETDVLVEVLWADPSSEAASLTGSAERARQFGRLMVEASSVPLWKSCMVAEVDGEVVGLLQQGTEEFGPSLRFLSAVVRVWGLGQSLRTLPRGWALQRVRVPTPADSWVVRELHVRPDLRNRGLGGLLLGQADTSARAAGFASVALTVRTNNPARRLYERAGYRTVRLRTHSWYRHWTGAEGRVLMVKALPTATAP